MIQMQVWRDGKDFLCVDAGYWDWRDRKWQIVDHYWNHRRKLPETRLDAEGMPLLEIACQHLLVARARLDLWDQMG